MRVVSEAEDVVLAELGVVVEVELGIDAHHVALGRLGQRIDLELRAIARTEELVELHELLAGLHTHRRAQCASRDC